MIKIWLASKNELKKSIFDISSIPLLAKTYKSSYYKYKVRKTLKIGYGVKSGATCFNMWNQKKDNYNWDDIKLCKQK